MAATHPNLFGFACRVKPSVVGAECANNATERNLLFCVRCWMIISDTTEKRARVRHGFRSASSLPLGVGETSGKAAEGYKTMQQKQIMEQSRGDEATDALRAAWSDLVGKRDRLSVVVDRLERAMESLGDYTASPTKEDGEYPERKPFRRTVLEEMSRSPKARITISQITRRMRFNGAPEFTAPFKTGLRGRIAVELAAMTRNVHYPIYRFDQGVYIYDETRKKTKFGGAR